MRKVTIRKSLGMDINKSYQGESIEMQMRKVSESGEPIESTSPEIFTKRDSGVEPQYDIRTDKWDIAMEAMDKVTKTQIAKREGDMKQNEDGKAESIQAPQSENSEK